MEEVLETEELLLSSASEKRHYGTTSTEDEVCWSYHLAHNTQTIISLDEDTHSHNRGAGYAPQQGIELGVKSEEDEVSSYLYDSGRYEEYKYVGEELDLLEYVLSFHVVLTCTVPSMTCNTER